MQTYRPIPRPAPTGGRKIVFEYIRQAYGVAPEYPWLQYPDDCTFKAPVSHKWYALLMNIKERHLGVSSERVVDVLNVKVDPAQMPALIDGVHYFAGYHMNKRHWLSIVLDDSTDYDRVRQLLDDSYRLVEKSKK